MSLEDLLKAMMGDAGGQQQRAGSGSTGDPLAEILQGILGGGSTSQQGGGGLEDILGSIMGGMSGSATQDAAPGATGGGMMDIISAILGGGAGGQAQQQTAPIIEGVSGKTGLSQVIVQMILSFVMSKLLGGLSGGGSGMGGLMPSAPAQGQGSYEGLDLDGLLMQMGQDDSVAEELAQQTGLDSQTAQQGLQEVLGALGAQRRAQGGAASKPTQGGLDDLLDNW